MLRIELAVVGNPNWVLLMAVFQLVKVTWLRRFVESIRKSRLNRPSKRNVRPIEAFKVNCAGPMIEFLPAFPH
jgi:hypothetical protein